MVNVTLCFSAAQALLAAKVGATFISPFVGRLDDIGEKGMDLISDIVIMYENYGFDTEVLVASVRNTQHLVDAAVIGAHVSTLPPKVIHELYKHPLLLFLFLKIYGYLENLKLSPSPFHTDLD